MRDTVGHLNNFSGIKTPNIDRIAKTGVVFENAHCAAPACSPSRTALFTGKYPTTTGHYENGQQWADEMVTMQTLTRDFMDNGYYTVGSGKLYHGKSKLPQFHTEFEVPFDKDYGEYGDVLGKPIDIPTEEMPDAQRVDFIINEINKVKNGPAFFGCGIVKPHLPFNVPQKYFDMFPLEDIPLPDA